MSVKVHSSAAAMIREAARDLSEWKMLLDAASEAQFVLIGEATHGTHEFYDLRAAWTKYLVEEKGFRVLALEADWPDMLRAHRYAIGDSDDRDAEAALGDFRRFPAWMWRNTVMVGFLEWLKEHNRSVQEPTGIFGMDLYSLHASMESVLRYLEETDPAAAQRARARYACFESFGEDPQHYGYATTRGHRETCEDEVVAQLVDLRRQYGSLPAREAKDAAHELFYAEQNARVVAGAESYYRAMFRGRNESWNLRDEHMAGTLEALARHFDQGRARIVAWAHNSHLGDARATDMGLRGEVNVGQLARERFGSVFSIGFSTWSGTVTAASDWGSPAERKRVRPAMEDSYEELFHSVERPSFWLPLWGAGAVAKLLRKPRWQRAIGVIYRPQTEFASHYFDASLSDQFDAIVHLDETRALQPLERTSTWDEGELPETYPHGT